MRHLHTLAVDTFDHGDNIREATVSTDAKITGHELVYTMAAALATAIGEYRDELTPTDDVDILTVVARACGFELVNEARA